MYSWEIITEIECEFARAVDKHPEWPTDAIHAAAILSEEAGELVQAANDFHHDSQHPRLDRYKMKQEAIQVGAMALRFLMHLEGYEPK